MINVLGLYFNRIRINRRLNRPDIGRRSLMDLKPGQQTSIKEYGDLPSSQLAALQAYGLLPGRVFTILQHEPVTIISIEYTELAFENQIARKLFVDTP